MDVEQVGVWCRSKERAVCACKITLEYIRYKEQRNMAITHQLNGHSESEKNLGAGAIFSTGRSINEKIGRPGILTTTREPSVEEARPLIFGFLVSLSRAWVDSAKRAGTGVARVNGRKSSVQFRPSRIVPT